MKTTQLVYLSLLALLMNSCLHPQQDLLEQAHTHIDSIQSIYAPDSREALFEVSVILQDDKLILKGETDQLEAKSELLALFDEEAILDSITILPDHQKKIWGLSILPVSNLRGKPTYSAELVSQVLAGTPIKILKQINGWSLVQTPDRYISWVLNSSYHTMDETEFSRWKQSNRVFIDGDTAQLFKEADSSSPIFSTMLQGSLLVALSEKEHFLKVELPNQTTAYIEKSNTKSYYEWVELNEPDTKQMIALGKSLSGRSYLWGGTSPAAMDCSGFIKTLFWSQGTILARDASLQVRHGIEISTKQNYNELQAGDLLYFGTAATTEQTERVTHVAFYLGNSEYIHAAGQVKINSLDPNATNYNEDRKSSLLHVRRVVNKVDTPGIQSVRNHPWYN